MAGEDVELNCEISNYKPVAGTRQPIAPLDDMQQTYWYFNGNLINYARTGGAHSTMMDKNFSIEWDPTRRISRLKLFNVQSSDRGNYTCKSISAEPATIILHVKGL